METSAKNLSFLFIITYFFVIQQSISLSAPTDVNGNTVHDPYSWAEPVYPAEWVKPKNMPYGPEQVYPVEGTSLGWIGSTLENMPYGPEQTYLEEGVVPGNFLYWPEQVYPAEGYNLGNVSYWPEQTYLEEGVVPGHVSYWSEQGDRLDEGDRESGGTNSVNVTNFFGTNSLSACELNSASLPSSEMGLSSEPGVLNVSEEPGALNVAKIVGNFQGQRVSYTPLLSSDVDIDLPVEVVGSVMPTEHAVEVAKDSFELAKNFEAKSAAVTATPEGPIDTPKKEVVEKKLGQKKVLVKSALSVFPSISEADNNDVSGSGCELEKVKPQSPLEQQVPKVEGRQLAVAEGDVAVVDGNALQPVHVQTVEINVPDNTSVHGAECELAKVESPCTQRKQTPKRCNLKNKKKDTSLPNHVMPAESKDIQSVAFPAIADTKPIQDAPWCLVTGKKGKSVEMVSGVATVQVVPEKPVKSKAQTEKVKSELKVNAKKEKWVESEPVRTVPTPKKQQCKKRNKGPQPNDANGMKHEDLDEILAEFKKKHPVSKPVPAPVPAQKGSDRSLHGISKNSFNVTNNVTKSNSLLGLSPKLPLPGLISNLFQIESSQDVANLLDLANGHKFSLNDNNINIISSLNIVVLIQQIRDNAVLARRVSVDVENPSQLFALYLVTLNISWILTHLSLEANGVKHNDVASERFVRITQNTADRASCAAYANFCSENTYVDTVLASVFGMGRRICELEALPPGRKPFNCPTDPAFTQIAKKYRGMEDVWPAVSQDKFLFDAINTYLIYSFMPSDNAKFVEEKIVRALTTSRALASFYMAVQCLKLCVSTEAAQQAVVFSLLVGELLSHCAGRLALLAYARASGIIIQEEVAGLGIRTCKTRGTNKLSWLIASGYAEIWLSLLGTIGCLEEYVVSGFALLTARGKESSSYLNAVMKSFPFIASDGNDAADLETLNLLEVNSFIDFCISLHREHSVQGEVQFCKNYHTRLVQGYAVEREGES